MSLHHEDKMKEDDTSPIMEPNPYHLRKRLRHINYDELRESTNDDPEVRDPSSSKKDKDVFSKRTKVEKDTEGQENAKPKLSEYEKLRQRNIAEKMALLQSLDIIKVKEGLTKKKTQRREKAKTLKDKFETPVRKSLRLQKLQPSSEPETPKHVFSSPEPKRHPSRTLGILDVLGEETRLPEEFSTRLKTFPEGKVEAVPLTPSKYKEYFPSMSLASHLVVKTLPTRVRSLALHPSTSSLLACAGGTYGYIGLWNANTLGDDGIYCTLHPHFAAVREVKFHTEYRQHLFTCSGDGTVRRFDLSTLLFDEIHATPDDDVCMDMDFYGPDALIVGHSDGTLAVVDTRTSDSRSGPDQVHRICKNHLKTVSVHPLQNEKVLLSFSSGSGDVFDMRMLKKKPSPIASFSARRSLSSAAFSPLTGKSILATSFDNTLRVMDSSEITGNLPVVTLISHNNYTGRWLTPFSATWLPDDEDNFVVGSMDYPRKIEVYNVNGKCIHEFTDELLTSVSSVNKFHPSLPVLVGGNSSGKLFIFVVEK